MMLLNSAKVRKEERDDWAHESREAFQVAGSQENATREVNGYIDPQPVSA